MVHDPPGRQPSGLGTLDDSVDFDGLVCGADQIARGALDQLLARGLRVPDDVGVIGFDNWPEARNRLQ